MKPFIRLFNIAFRTTDGNIINVPIPAESEFEALNAVRAGWSQIVASLPAGCTPYHADFPVQSLAVELHARGSATKNLLNVYRAALHKLPMGRLQPVKLSARLMNGIGLTSREMAEHCLWMLDEMEVWTEPLPLGATFKECLDATGKASRWLGFIQGWLWHQGVFTIDELRDQTRKALGK
jgi:hypothetical protein